MPYITLDFLIRDEIETLDVYMKFLNKGVKNPKMIPIIKKIIAEERSHIRMLSKIKMVGNIK